MRLSVLWRVRFVKVAEGADVGLLIIGPLRR
jgi:hypothetical protein